MSLIYELFVQNRLYVETLYNLLIVALSLFIYAKTRKFYSLSSYKGFRYFSLAFLFFALAFAVRYVFALVRFGAEPDPLIFQILFITFDFLITIAGFTLVYSLIWKHFEHKELTLECKSYFHMLSQSKVYVLYVTAAIIAILDFYFTQERQYFVFLPQLAAFGLAIFISASHCHRSNQLKTPRVAWVFLLAMVLGFIGYLVNFLDEFIFPYFEDVIPYTYVGTVSIFVILLLAVEVVFPTTKKKK